MTLYFLSGLGADKRIFQKLNLPDQYKIVHIDWIKPEYNETITSYAQRLSENINQNEPFAIIGLSFGGMVASELSKIVNPFCTIIISSISTSKEMPAHFSAVKLFRLYKLIPKHILKIKSPFVYWFMGAKTMREKAIFNSILKDTDIHFFRWAISAIMKWNHNTQIQNLHHIHGTADNIFPIKNTRAEYIIKGGGHLMAYSQAKEVSAILTDILER